MRRAVLVLLVLLLTACGGTHSSNSQGHYVSKCIARSSYHGPCEESQNVWVK